MLSVLLSPYYQFLVLISLLLLSLGMHLLAAVFLLIYRHFAISASLYAGELAIACSRLALNVAIVFCVIVILHLLIGGGTNAH